MIKTQTGTLARHKAKGDKHNTRGEKHKSRVKSTNPGGKAQIQG